MQALAHRCVKSRPFQRRAARAAPPRGLHRHCVRIGGRLRIPRCPPKPVREPPNLVRSPPRSGRISFVFFDDDLVSRDHGSAHCVDPVPEHVSLDLRGVKLVYVAPAFSHEVRLVTVELEVPVAHPVEIAVQPFAGREAEPVLVVVKLDPVAGWKSRFGAGLGADAIGFHPGLLEGLRAIGFRLADLSVQCGCLAQDRRNHKYYERNKT